SGPLDPGVYQSIYQANLKMVSDYAVAHRIPLMVAESSPQKNFLPALGQAAWDGWYQKLFDYIAEYDVKALCYINENWPDYGWDSSIFGDSRVQTNPYVFSRWQAAVAPPRFIHAGSAFYSQIGFSP
ncbi:MAG TPA: hypothetical protein VGM44_11505, partial [Polyangiaceae bacterium]